MRAIATTITGLEDIASEEVSSIVKRSAEPDISKVFVDCSLEELVKLVLASRGVNKVLLELLRASVHDLSEIGREVRSLDLEGVLSPDQTFAVRAERIGIHEFTSLDIASAVGSAIVHSYQSSRGVRLRVDLRRPDVEFHALLRGDQFTLGVNLVGRSLQRRFYRIAHHRASLPATLAYLMVRYSGWSREQVLVDPFCGSGTIPIEAGLAGLNVCPTVYKDPRELALNKLRFIDREVFESVRDELVCSEFRDAALRIFGSDLSLKALDAAKKNIETARLSGKVVIERIDALNFEYRSKCRELGAKVFVVTDPPFGIRSGPSDPFDFYVRAFSSIRKGIGGGRLLAIFSKQAVALRAIQEAGWTVIETRKIKYGHLEALMVKAAT
ncbi:MAG: THUMP domain-containing protein [Thaumarchaeota archaeon]|nr:THUMP domain-containing protein [Candidatus Calditenuaceae archaeon]MDW8186483.1 THUMP domain-containing protein [Nitrososphaerota archaeon]